MAESTTTRLGVRIPRQLSAARLTGLARQAERAGLDEVWVVLDCFYAGAVATAATILAPTQTIAVGIGCCPRSPATRPSRPWNSPRWPNSTPAG
jgi:5,10-methylenetetrahydromethanopterin reductase